MNMKSTCISNTCTNYIIVIVMSIFGVMVMLPHACTASVPLSDAVLQPQEMQQWIKTRASLFAASADCVHSLDLKSSLTIQSSGQSQEIQKGELEIA